MDKQSDGKIHVTSIYTRAQMDNFKQRLAKAIFERGLAADEIVNNTDYKNFVSNYAQTEIVDKKMENALKGISHRFSNMEFQFNGGNKPPRTYPVINEYQGHDLTKTYFFAKTADGGISVDLVSVVDKRPSILIP